MGEALGIPEWLAVLLWVLGLLIVVVAYGFYSVRKAHHRLAESRPNLSREQFLAMMEPDCSTEAAEFLWDHVLFYVRSPLSPHPDDEFSKDLRIDDDDWSMDWPREFADQQGFHESNLPDWPAGWPPTLRNFGRWLSMGPV
ncbi:hypothetical protein [Croceibacterium aestuarii]|uniref:hypothetical protein n=1 Tax=Croceibacterium aestuarii TaxID=3064139 RepID=UPI00272ECAF9|nr:hypothetical protein [Croceibacterium sp. D39]